MQEFYGLAKIASTTVKQEKVHSYLKQNYPADTLKWVKNTEWTEENVPLSQIKMSRRPGGARENDKVKGIAQAFKDGKPMEPVVLVKAPDGTHKVADGYHRTLGCKHAGKTTIKAYVGRVIQVEGPWDKEMHARKLNVGKAAFETFDEFEKNAGVIGGVARLGGKMIKSTGKEIANFGKGITGLGTKGAKKNLEATKLDPSATRTDIKAAKKNVGKEQRNRVKSFGIAGLGATGVGANAVLNKPVEPEPLAVQQQQQFDTFRQPY